MGATENKNALRKIYEHFACGDVAAMATFLSDDAIITEAETLPYGGDFVGPAGLHDVVAQIMTVWEGLVFDIDDILVSETRAAAFGTFRAKSRATGAHVNFRLCEIWEFANGKVVRCLPIYSDTALALRALGS